MKSRYVPLYFSHKNDNHQDFWVCLCSCGEERTVRIDRVMSGEIKSCGCFNREVIKKSKFENRMSREAKIESMLFSYFKSEAKRRKIPFELTKEQCRKLSFSPCFYCGQKEQNTMKIYREKLTEDDKDYFKYNGIDRKDSSKGYSLNNALPACGKCNKMKLNLSVEEFLKHIEKIYKRFKK